MTISLLWAINILPNHFNLLNPTELASFCWSMYFFHRICRLVLPLWSVSGPKKKLKLTAWGPTLSIREPQSNHYSTYPFLEKTTFIEPMKLPSCVYVFTNSFSPKFYDLWISVAPELFQSHCPQLPFVLTIN